MFEAVILMGGFGTRLKSISGDTPKPMMPVSGRPFVYHLLEKLEKAGCNKIVLSLHYQAEDIKQQILKDSPVDCELIFAVEDSPRGTGGGMKLAAEFISGKNFIALNGDTYSGIDYLDFFHNTQDNDLVISGVKVNDSKAYGSLNFDSNHNLLSMTEKGLIGPAVINSGTYLVSKSAIMQFSSSKFSFEESFIPSVINSTKVYLFDGDFIDIGIPEDYYKACEIL
jgi:D-glycero-alpha-D-manno-heptose 1-phosphate guanylyltransferase